MIFSNSSGLSTDRTSCIFSHNHAFLAGSLLIHRNMKVKEHYHDDRRFY